MNSYVFFYNFKTVLVIMFISFYQRLYLSKRLTDGRSVVVYTSLLYELLGGFQFQI